MNRRVVITGMGIHSCIGSGVEQVERSLRQGRSGIGILPQRKEFGYRSALSGIVPPVDLKGKLDRRSRLGLSEQGNYAYQATTEAFAMAGIDEEFLRQREVGILYGNDSSMEAVITGVDTAREKRNTILVGSGNVFQSMTSTVSMNLSVIFGLRGVSFTVAGACASGSHAIGMAYLLISGGLQDCVVCGGAQETNLYSAISFDALGAFSTREEDPTRASRPFDRDRDGLVPSGGGATLLLESYESAVSRGVPILAEIAGYGFSSSGENISAPNVDGPLRAMRMALSQAAIEPERLGYVNAHATSTPIGDSNEAEALRALFEGEESPLITSTKSQTGHEMWMAGASELIYSILMMRGGFVAPNINLENPDPSTEGLNIPAGLTELDFDSFISNSFGFGGTNSSLVVKKYEK